MIDHLSAVVEVVPAFRRTRTIAGRNKQNTSFLALEMKKPQRRRWLGGYEVQEYGEPDAYGDRKKASVAESLADEIKRRAGEETITSDLTYDLRSGDPDFVDKLVGLTFGNMAYDAILA
jgi:hypothetical protein